MTRTRRLVFLTFVLCLFALIAMACGGDGSDAPPTTPQVVATMPPARFTAVAEQSAAQTSGVSPKVESLSTPTVDASVSRGETIYNNKKCAECHGSQGEGVAGKGKALAGSTLTYQEFETVLRTGGQGALGPEHLYGQSSVSPSGMTTLYAFVASLTAK
ncbi:MAG: c-type cytochrome [Chloroflexi bacterium]|nr:c-type cytochrome [Chloroflexota bacterium]